MLAGGKSTRLGRDKASAPLLGVPMLQRVLDRLAGLTDETVIVGRRDQDLGWAQGKRLRVIHDLFPGRGPAEGLCTGLEAIEAPLAVAVACDMPLIEPALVSRLLQLASDHEAIVPVSEGLPQPLCAVYRQSCGERIRAQIAAGNLKLILIISHLNVRYVEQDEWCAFDREGLSFQNLNSEDALKKASKLLADRVP